MVTQLGFIKKENLTGNTSIVRGVEAIGRSDETGAGKTPTMLQQLLSPSNRNSGLETLRSQ